MAGRARRLRRGTFTSVADLIAAIRRFIDGWNDRCQPFVWTKDADTILAKHTVKPLQERGTSGFGTECVRARQEWTVAVDSDTGFAFRPGQASLSVDESAIDGFDFTSRYTTQVVTLEAAPTAATARAG